MPDGLEGEGKRIAGLLLRRWRRRTRLEALEQEFAALKSEITAIKAQPHGLSYAGGIETDSGGSQRIILHSPICSAASW